MPYFVIDPSGNAYGPADLPLLHQWVAEGRVTAATTLRDSVSGQTMMATAIPGLLPGSGQMPYSNPYGQPPMNQPLGTPSGYYPRPANANSQDITTAWILAALSLVCCGPFTAIPGLIISKRLLNQGNELARGPYIVSWIGLILSILGFLFRIFAGSF